MVLTSKPAIFIVSVLIGIGLGTAYFKWDKSEVKKEIETVKVENKTSHKITKRTYNSEGKIAYEEIDQFVNKKMTTKKEVVITEAIKKDYLVGMTTKLDLNYNNIDSYNIIVGRRLIFDIYIIGKTSTQLSDNELGLIWNF